MARNDRQFTPLGDVAAPASWTIPATVEIIPKAVSAVFDGSAAASAFLPTLDVISDSGVIVARVPTGSTVAAGGSAEVTWAPFLESTAATAPAASTLPLASVLLDPTTTTYLAGAHAPIISQVKTNTAGASVFSFNAGDPTYLQIAQAGLYAVYAVWGMSNPATLAIGSFLTVGIGPTGLIGSSPQLIEELASTTGTRVIQDAYGFTVEQYAGPDKTRYVFHNGQTFNNVGPLGWTIWQLTTDVMV